ncbi:dsDNA nuclease domain-containing protein [Peribacillus butanolivorans]|uniref:dsDNA nuclease domain-containing protein n=1 Tax=Peribacillus butanolivorans TaxID=421767 RepID=UPI0036D9DE5F
MSLADYYMNLPYDLSGGMAKNRFRNEILWGLKRMLELYKENIEFTVVFDYSCDIEVHREDGFEFYQVKTQNDNGSYTIDKLTNKDRSGSSILGKLYKLKYDEIGEECDETKVSLVSNAPLNDGKKTHNTTEIIDLSKIDDEAILKIKKRIKEQLKLGKDVNLRNSSFVRTGIDLINPQNTLIGEIAIFFEDKFNCEPVKINSLYRLLSGEINNKASYELKIFTYDEILKQKGVNKSFLDNVFHNYAKYTDTAVEKVNTFISKYYEDKFLMRVKLNSALSKVLTNLNISKHLKKLETEISEYIRGNLDNLPDSDFEIVNQVYGEMHNKKTIEISDEEFRALVLLVFKRFEEGVYSL